ncbi:unnamed protein product [Ectocarpus sp. 12 AP-2014]
MHGHRGFLVRQARVCFCAEGHRGGRRTLPPARGERDQPLTGL